jgi:hypothetical protein
MQTRGNNTGKADVLLYCKENGKMVLQGNSQKHWQEKSFGGYALMPGR